LDPLQTAPPLLQNVIATLDDKGSKIVADLGCGIGRLVEQLVKEGFQCVFAIDNSDAMLAETSRRIAAVEDPSSSVVDRINMRNLRSVYNRFDAVFSINSILPREPSDTRRMLREASATLKTGGLFIAILPAFDTITALKAAELPLFVERRRHGRFARMWPLYVVLGSFDRWRAYNVEKRMSGWFGNTLGRLKPVRFVWRKVFARLIGPNLYADDGANVQRFITVRQIRKRLERAGLQLHSGYPKRVHYEWEDAIRCGYGNFANPNDEPQVKAVYGSFDKVFDWFVVAEKP